MRQLVLIGDKSTAKGEGVNANATYPFEVPANAQLTPNVVPFGRDFCPLIIW